MGILDLYMIRLLILRNDILLKRQVTEYCGIMLQCRRRRDTCAHALYMHFFDNWKLSLLLCTSLISGADVMFGRKFLISLTLSF